MSVQQRPSDAPSRSGSASADGAGGGGDEPAVVRPGAEPAVLTPQFSWAVGRALGAVVVTVRGRLDSPNTGRLEVFLLGLVEGPRSVSLVVDLRQAELIDDAAVTAALATVAALAEFYGVGVTLSVTSDSPLWTLLRLNGNGTAVTSGAYRGHFRLAVAPGGRHLLVQEARRVHPSGLGLSTIPNQQGDHP